jgi:hypothetical protein
MRRLTSVVAVAAVGVLALAGCGSPPEDVLATDPPETPAELVLPEDAVLGLVAIVTAPNGATADLAVIVHASLPYLVPEAEEAMATTIGWCAGEVDETVITGRGYTFTAVDVTLTPRDGDWPDDLMLAVAPQPNPEFGSTLAADDGLVQVDASDDDSFGDAVPRCRQPAVLEGAGGGTVYLGIPSDITGANDAASFTAWTFHDFGLSAVLPGELGESETTFSSCVASITPLGSEFGAPSPTWADTASDSACLVGGAST